jgi:hypothetical protein
MNEVEPARQLDLCSPWRHRLRIRLDRLPFVFQCRDCLHCWSGMDPDGRPVGEPYPVDPTVPIQDAVSKKAETK